jgi:hypothetical protein
MQPDYVSRYDDNYEDEFEGAELAEEYERATRDQEVAKRRSGERTQIQPAETEPRAPHLAPAPHATPDRRRRGNTQFGAGIFD